MMGSFLGQFGEKNIEQAPGQLRAIGCIHFVGIGGIGMSGIAEILHNQGFRVQGSDLAENANVHRLRGLGIKVFIGQDAANIIDADVVSISSAVKEDNPEVQGARAKKIPVVRRAEMLAEIMRLKPAITIAGTHGKTTTTSLIASVLDGGGLDPTVINGGIINAYGTNARLGQGDWMVVEGDESDGTFVRLPSTIAVITNIDPEHLEHYGSFDALKDAFKRYIENIPFYGVGVVCLDHIEVQALVEKIPERRLVTYGFNEQADIRAINVRLNDGGQNFSVLVRDPQKGIHHAIDDLYLPMAGTHNLQNALAAIAVGLELSIDPEKIKQGLAQFKGVKRRFTFVGHFNGAQVIDDYAHHPVEISAVMSSARSVAKGRVIAVLQPHRFTRLRDLFLDFCTCLNGADMVLVLPVYAAGEEPIDGFSASNFVEGLRSHGHQSVELVKNVADLPDRLSELVHENDLIVCMGAGSISAIAYELVEGQSA